MTMDISPDQVRYIADKLDSHSVTFSLVSRDLGLHVSQAKRVLYAYYSLNKEKLNALYVASGTQGTKKVVKIVESPEESALLDQFDQISSIHIFSISQSLFTFSNSDIALEQLRRPVDFAKVESYYEQGMIRGRPLKVRSRAPRPKAEPIKPKEEVKKEAPKAETKPKLQYQSRKEKPQTSLLSNYVSRKGETKQKEDETKKRKSEQPSGYQYKSRKTESKQPKERVIVSHDAGNHEPEEEEPQKKPAPAKTTDLNTLFLDDLSDFSDNDDTNEAQEKDEPIVVEEDVKSKPQEEAKATVAPLLPQNSSLRSLTSKSPTPQAGENAGTASAGEPEEHEPETEPVTTVDNEGYIVTKKAEPKKAEPKKEAKPAARQSAPAKKATSSKKSDGPKKQALLMSFFDRR